MFQFIEFVKVDNNKVRSIVKGLIIANNGHVTNGQVTEAFAKLHDELNLTAEQHIDQAQIQNAFNFYRFAKSQAAFRAAYNF